MGPNLGYNKCNYDFSGLDAKLRSDNCYKGTGTNPKSLTSTEVTLFQSYLKTFTRSHFQPINDVDRCT
jgi:hypothetical protein